MTLTATPLMLYPAPLMFGEDPAESDDLLDGATDRHASKIYMPASGTVTHIEFYIDAATSTDQLDVEGQLLSASTDMPETTIQFLHQATAVGVLFCIGYNFISMGTARLMEQFRKNKRLDFEHDKWDGEDRRK